MSLTALMIEQIGAARTIVEDGAEVVPVWRINTPEGGYLIFTRFDYGKPEQRERVFLLISRFMTWKMATSFVFTAEETREGDEALLAIGVSHHHRLGLLQRIAKRDPVSFGKPEWLMPDQVDETYFRLIPRGSGEITIEEIAELASIFGEGGEMPAERLS